MFFSYELDTVECVAIKEATPRLSEPSPEAFITERRGSDVEGTTSEDELDREILALREKGSTCCPSVRE